jgi:hypothetical protein
MGRAFDKLMMTANLAVLPLFAQQKPPLTSAASSTTGGVVSELAKQWWLWTGIILLLGLVGLLFYLRNRTDDD